MLFILKKILSQLIAPTTLLFLCISIGTGLVIRKKRQVLGRILLISATMIVLLSGYSWLPNLLLHNLEKRYPPYAHSESEIEWMLVLGRGFSSDPEISESSRIDGVMQARLTEALYILRNTKNMNVVVSLAGPEDARSKQLWWKSWCQSVQLPDCKIILLTDALDTDDEIRLAMPHVGTNSFVMVTSAAHMPRAMLMARTMGGHPIAEPCDYLVKKSQSRYPQWIPSPRNMDRLDLALHEYFGLLWYKVVCLFSGHGLALGEG